MSTAVLYMSRYGTTKEYAEIIAAQLGSGSAAIDLRADKRPDLTGYSSAIIGVSIYAGRPVIGFTRTLERLRDELLGMRIGLFITCMYEGERAAEQLMQAYPGWLHAHAAIAKPFGGRFIPEIMKPLDRWILKAASKTSPAASKFDKTAAMAFADDFSA